MLSQDVDFSGAGAKSRIKYSKSFKLYRGMLAKTPRSPAYERIFAEFDSALFGRERVLSDEFVADNGNYAAALEKYNTALRLEEAADVEANGGSPLPPSPAPPPSPILPPSPLQSDHRILISVTLLVSHTIAGSSQVSNVINSPAPPSDREDVEGPPPVKAQPVPKKKTRGKQLVATSEAETDATTTRTRSSRKAKTAPPEPATRPSRKRNTTQAP